MPKTKTTPAMTATLSKGGKTTSEVTLNVPPGMFGSGIGLMQSDPEARFVADSLEAHDDLVKVIREAVDGHKCDEIGKAMTQVLTEVMRAAGKSVPGGMGFPVAF